MMKPRVLLLLKCSAKTIVIQFGSFYVLYYFNTDYICYMNIKSQKYYINL